VRPIDGLNKSQRIVIVVAIGIAFGALGLYLTRLGSPRIGWYAYPALAPGVGPPSMGLPAWLRLIIWLGLTGIWALASVIMLRPPSASQPQPAQEGSHPGQAPGESGADSGGVT
jgi:hypothetical protein